MIITCAMIHLILYTLYGMGFIYVSFCWLSYSSVLDYIASSSSDYVYALLLTYFVRIVKVCDAYDFLNMMSDRVLCISDVLFIRCLLRA